MAEVRLEHVYKTYRGGVKAVIDLNLTIRDGEFLTLLGPSGCGKTSTLRMIVGLEDITDGQIVIGNRVVNKLGPNERNVALAFETYALYPPLRVYDNIAFCLRARGIARGDIDRRVQEVATMLEITDILERKPAELGGGQKQRVSLARALVREPDVFLMDEPLSHLDAAQRAHMRSELKRLHARTGRTTVLVTHDQLEAVAMAERIAVMDLGVLQQVGPFNEIFNSPVNKFVAGFIGEPPMNFLPCTISSQAGDVVLRSTDGSFSVKLPPELAHKVKNVTSDSIEIGIRPINIVASHQPVGNGVVEVEGRVFTFEALGEEGQMVASVGSQQVLIVTPAGEHFEKGEPVWLEMQTKRLHLFDAQSGLAL